METVKDKKKELFDCIDRLRRNLEVQSFELQSLKILLNYFFGDI